MYTSLGISCTRSAAKTGKVHKAENKRAHKHKYGHTRLHTDSGQNEKKRFTFASPATQKNVLIHIPDLLL